MNKFCTQKAGKLDAFVNPNHPYRINKVASLPPKLMNDKQLREAKLYKFIPAPPPATNMQHDVASYSITGVTMTETFTEKLQPLSHFVLLIQAEAERRIEEGVLINGIQFRCNGPSINRVMGIVSMAKIIEARGGNFTQTFTTSAGVVVTLNSALEATGVFIKASGHVSKMLEKSSLLQTSVAAMTPTKLKAFDPSLDKHWV